MFHYPPRCRRARFAKAGSKACVDRSARFRSPPQAGCPGGAPFVAVHTGFVPEMLCIQLFSNVYGPPYLSGGFWAISGASQ